MKMCLATITGSRNRGRLLRVLLRDFLRVPKQLFRKVHAKISRNFLVDFCVKSVRARRAGFAKHHEPRRRALRRLECLWIASGLAARLLRNL